MSRRRSSASRNWLIAALKVAGIVVDATDVGQRQGDRAAVAERAPDGERLAVKIERLAERAAQPVDPTHVVESRRDPAVVARDLEQLVGRRRCSIARSYLPNRRCARARRLYAAPPWRGIEPPRELSISTSTRSPPRCGRSAEHVAQVMQGVEPGRRVDLAEHLGVPCRTARGLVGRVRRARVAALEVQCAARQGIAAALVEHREVLELLVAALHGLGLEPLRRDSSSARAG